MSRHDLRDLEALRETKPPPSAGELDAYYYPGANEREVRYLRDEPTLAARTACWLWALGGFVAGMVAAVALYTAGGGK